MNDDAGTEKSDAGEDALNDSAGGVGNIGADNSRVRKQHHDGGGEADQAERAHADRLAMQVAIEPDGAGRDGRCTQAKRNLG